jgi:NADH-quinone oxidoreductase subunit M
LLAMCEENIFITAVATFAIVFGSVYSIWLFNRIFLGPLKISQFTDLSKKEKYIAILLILLILWFGINPNQFLNNIYNILLLT